MEKHTTSLEKRERVRGLPPPGQESSFLPAFILLGLLLVASCGRESSPTADAPPDDSKSVARVDPHHGALGFNVLILLADTTRTDAVGFSGYDRAHTPNMDRLAAEGVRYANARATSCWTLPSHASLFTGLYPSHHGANHESRVMPEDRVTVAELLSPTHLTAGFSENPNVSRARGLAQGFSHFVELWRGPNGLPLDTVGLVKEWLWQRDSSRPFFLFVNMMSPHYPYDPPERLEKLFTTPDDELRLPELRGFDGPEARAYLSGALRLSPDDFRILRALYDAEVATVDEQIGEILRTLSEIGEFDRTLIILASDHGEHLGEHDLLDHQFALYEPVLRIPLVMRLPSYFEGGGVRESNVQLIDVAPTILTTLGIDHPRMDGANLHAGDPDPDRPVVAEYMRPLKQQLLFEEANPSFDFSSLGRRIKSIQVGTLKLIVFEDGQTELYDLKIDPAEEVDLSTSRPDDVTVLLKRIEDLGLSWNPHTENVQPPSIDEETRRQLRSLGYVN